jgi:lipopolysaccharide transport system ATP-binding protein
MNPLALRVRGLGKRYRLGARQPYRTLRDALASLFRPRAETKVAAEFWALRDVSFELHEGEALGIVGRNGAGKSTLLKLLSRITVPDEGIIELTGRVGALLEVGTGFHPELSGRENVFLNGVLLGMSAQEVRKKFDEIVAFAGVEEFLDTPVKRYSSGMRVRLAFATADYLEPDILVVDEVLAVGDAQFQQKCLGRMGEVANQGRTVLFVSHQMESIMTLCERAIWLDEGKVMRDGPAPEVVNEYLESCRVEVVRSEVSERKDRRGSGAARITAIRLSGWDRPEVPTVLCGGGCAFEFAFRFDASQSAADARLKIAVRDSFGRIVVRFASDYVGYRVDRLPASGAFVLSIPKLALVPGRYSMDFTLRLGGVLSDRVVNAYFFDVLPADYFGTGTVIASSEATFFHEQEWKLEPSAPR